MATIRIGYRSGEQYYERGLSARDIVVHEVDNLGNALKVLVSWEDLARIRSQDVTWVCASEQDARRYGGDVYTVEYTQVLAFDEETPEGMLVVVV